NEKPLVLSALVCAAVNAQTPLLISATDPEYSSEARLARLEGSVIVSASIGKYGELQNAGIRRTLGLGLDEQAIESLRHWRFAAGAQGQTEVTVNFRLPLEKNTWHLDKAVFDIPADATRSVLQKA